MLTARCRIPAWMKTGVSRRQIWPPRMRALSFSPNSSTRSNPSSACPKSWSRKTKPVTPIRAKVTGERRRRKDHGVGRGGGGGGRRGGEGGTSRAGAGGRGGGWGGGG